MRESAQTRTRVVATMARAATMARRRRGNGCRAVARHLRVAQPRGWAPISVTCPWSDIWNGAHGTRQDAWTKRAGQMFDKRVLFVVMILMLVGSSIFTGFHLSALVTSAMPLCARQTSCVYIEHGTALPWPTGTVFNKSFPKFQRHRRAYQDALAS